MEETVEDLKRIMGDFTDQEKQLHPEEYDRILMEFIWENRDIARILMDGAEGTRYDNFREDSFSREQFAYLIGRSKGTFYVVVEQEQIIASIIFSTGTFSV